MTFETTGFFDRQAKKLAKRFKHLKSDLAFFLEEFALYQQKAVKIKPGVFKVRVSNSDKQRGKSGGYRIYYFLAAEERTVFLAIYDKSDLENLDEAVIDGILSEADLER